LKKLSKKDLEDVRHRKILSKKQIEHDTRLFEQMGGLGDEISTKIVYKKSGGGLELRSFRNRLRMELSRHTKETQWILNGVSKGMFLKKVKFE